MGVVQKLRNLVTSRSAYSRNRMYFSYNKK